jgi:DegV family protein with EDD domain
MTLHIVMDGAGDLPDSWTREFTIDIIPVNIQIAGVTYLQGVELSDDEFYHLADAGGEFPKTSQPTPQQFVDFYKQIAALGDTILSLHVTSRLSGTFESAVLAARELAGKYNIIPLDSKTGSAALGFMCKEARLMERAGESLQRILARMQFISRNITVVLTLDTLDYAVRSGRVKALQAAIASILQVKPVVVLRDGVLQMADRVRTRKKALDHIVDLVKQQVGGRQVNVAVVHAKAPDVAQYLLDKVRTTLNCCETIVTELSIGVAANLGPGTVGIVAYPVDEGS